MKSLFFIKSLITNCLLSLGPVLILTVISIYISNREARLSAERNNWNLLYQTESYMDYLFDQADNITLYFSHIPDVMTYLPRSFRAPSLSREDLNNINTHALYLQNITGTNDDFYSIHVYYENDYGRFLTSETGRMTTVDTFYDKDWLASYRRSEKDRWCEVRTLQRNSFSKPFQVISIYRKIYSPLSPDTPIGVIVAQLNYEKLLDYLHSLALTPNHVLVLLDDQSRVIIQSRDMELKPLLSTFLAQSGEEPAKTHTISHKGTDYSFTYLTSARSEHWTYLSLVPSSELYATSFHLVRVITAFSACALLIFIVMSAKKAHNDYQKLENIMNILENPGQAAAKNQSFSARIADPYHFIMQNILNMFLQQDYLQVQISEKKYRMQVLEMQALQQQINPHFLYNTLHTIYWEALRLSDGPNTCSRMISNLSSILEYSLGDSGTHVQIQDELNYLHAYVDIQEVRYGQFFRIIWEIDEMSVAYPIPKMILQPLVENAITHGFTEKNRSGVIKIKSYYRKDHIYIAVADNGAGMSRERLLDLREKLRDTDLVENHIGLLNTHRRLVLTYGKEYGIHIGSHENAGTDVHFSLPAESAEAEPKTPE